MKFAAATTLYDPKESFIDNLLNNAETFPLLLVYDNSSDNRAYVDRLREKENIVYHWDGINHGLPEVFNRAIDECRERGVDFLCTLDQDSVLGADTAARMEAYLSGRDTSHIAAVGTCRGRQFTEDAGEDPAVDVDWLICSGCFLNLRVLKEHGITYDEAYFVDRFDEDLCRRLKKAGLRIRMLRNAYMAHSLGEGRKYSPLRNYYVFRNRFYFNKKHFGAFAALYRSTLQTARHVLGLLREGAAGREKLRSLPVAWRDYRRGRMGPISPASLAAVTAPAEKDADRA